MLVPGLQGRDLPVDRPRTKPPILQSRQPAPDDSRRDLPNPHPIEFLPDKSGKTLQIVPVRTDRMRRIALLKFQMVKKGLYPFFQFTDIFYPKLHKIKKAATTAT